MKTITLPLIPNALYAWCRHNNVLGAPVYDDLTEIVQNYAKQAVEQDRKSRYIPIKEEPYSGPPLMNVPKNYTFSEEQIRTEMLRICQCRGKYACDCVSVQNYAIQDLWYRKNTNGHEHPRPNGYP